MAERGEIQAVSIVEGNIADPLRTVGQDPPATLMLRATAGNIAATLLISEAEAQTRLDALDLPGRFITYDVGGVTWWEVEKDAVDAFVGV